MSTMSGGGSLGRRSRLSTLEALLSIAIFLLLAVDLATTLTLQRSARVARSPTRGSSGSNNGVRLNGRAKQHGAGEVCPRLSYCKCRSRGKGLDITCERINAYKLEVRLRKVEKDVTRLRLSRFRLIAMS